MIVRTWMAYAKPENVPAYREHLEGTVLPELRQLGGFLGLTLCQADIGDRVELLVISRWQSMDAIKAFAGTGLDRAVVKPAAKALLDEYDNFAAHYEVAVDAAGSGR